ncbi:MAG: hypothetical protein GY926_12465 [bacterium]|nr:hypothetical protein [bacterium]
MRISALRNAVGLAVVGVAAFCVSCSSAVDESPALEAAELTELEIHTRNQESIAQCMAEQGFEYDGVPFRELVDKGGEDHFNVDGALRIGYGALLIAVSDSFFPVVGEPESYGAELQAFQEALLGSAVLEGGNPGGCVGEAVGEIEQLRQDSADFEEYVAIRQELDGLGAYLEYSDAWRLCLGEEGYDAPAGDPLGARTGYFFAHLEEFNRAIETAELTVDQEERSISVELLLTLVRSDDRLQSLLEREVELAVADSSCRDELADEYFAEYQDLVEQLAPIPIR